MAPATSRCSISTSGSVNAVTRFADKEALSKPERDPLQLPRAFPGHRADFDAFYTNPPWGASNDGESVKVFMQRGIEAIGVPRRCAVVVADDPELQWPRRVLASLQQAAISAGFFVQRMMPQVHSYHLDDAPDLRSCNVLLRAVASG